MMAYYESALRDWAIPIESITAQTRFGPAHILVSGPQDAPPLLLLHGLGDTALLWMTLFGSLGSRYRLFAPDIPGQPGKSAPVRLPYTGLAYPQWLQDVLDALDVARTDVVGLSLGSYLALRLGAAAPQRVRRLGLLSPAGMAPVRLSALLQLLPVGLFPSRALCRWFMERYGATVTDQALERASLMSKHYIPAPPPPILSAGELSRVSAPVSLLIGEHEIFFNVEAVIRRARQYLPNVAAADIVPGAGHNLVRERPELIESFVLSTFGS